MTTQTQPTSTQKSQQISRKDLPLHCPMDTMSLWNSHPRVYLPIEESGKIRCPYCGTLYELQD